MANQYFHYHYYSQGTSPGASDLFSPEHKAERMMNLLLRSHQSEQEAKEKMGRRNIRYIEERERKIEREKGKEGSKGGRKEEENMLRGQKT